MIGNTLENTPLKIAIVAGERSGDELGAPLMKSLKSINPSIEFVGVGGSKMTSEGLESYFDMSEISVMGIIEPCLLYTSPSPRDATLSRMPSSA